MAYVPPSPKQKRNTQILIAAGVVVVIAVVVALVVVFTGGDDKGTDKAGTPTSANVTPAAAPTVLSDTGSFRRTAVPEGQKPAVVVTIYEDFQCPVCRQFESTYGSTLVDLAKQDGVAIDYHPVSILDRMGNGYSTRAASASMCIAEGTKGKDNFAAWLKWHTLMYDNQPPEGGNGLSNEQIIELAKQAGVVGLDQCINSSQYASLITSDTEKLGQTGFQGTPTVRINGKDWELQGDPQALVDAVNAAKAAQ